jgi:tetratricopeptide (TPR) repeat protein
MQVKMDTKEINKLFEKAVSYFNQSGHEDTIKEACNMFQKVIQKNPKFRTDDGGHGDNPYYYMGRYHDYCLGDFETAKEYYTKSIELCPKDSASYECRGVCWLKANQYELALEDFRRATKYKGNSGEDMLPDLDGIIVEVENRLGGGKPNKEYDGLFNIGI